MADIKQIKVGNTTYNIEPVTAYLPLSGGTLTGKLYINAPLNNPGSSDPSLAINYSTSAQTISEANLNMIKFGSLDNYIGEAPASRTIEGIPAFAFHTTMGDNSEFAWLSAGWDHRMSLGAGGLTLHKGKLTLVDDIAYKGAKSSGSIIKFMNNTADIYGNGIRIGGGGATIIGGGESADLPSVSGGDEVLYLMNDGNIDFYSNCQDGLSSAKHMTFDTSGNLNVPANVDAKTISVDTINGKTLGNAIVRQNASTGDVILGSTVRPLRLWGNGDRPTYSKDDGASYSDLALLSDLDSKLNNYGNLATRPNGNSLTFPSGANPVQMRSGATTANDIGIFRLSDDNAFICNSSDDGYAFAVFDTDQTSDFSTASNAAFAVLSNHTGVSVKGGLTVDGTSVSLNGHTHSYLPLGGGALTGTLNLQNSSAGISFTRD